MAFKLSQRSLSRLEGVDDALVAVVTTAIESCCLHRPKSVLGTKFIR